MNRHTLRKTLLHALLAASSVLAGCGGGGAAATSAQLASAKAYFEKQDYAAAVIELKSALQKSPDNRELRLLLGRSLLATGDAATAAIELQKALDLGASPNDVQPLLAKALLGQNNLRQVVLQFADVRLDRSDASADLKTTVATAQAALGERERALATTLSALGDSPQHVPATLLQARLKAAGGDIDGGLALVDQVLAGSSTNLAAMLLKGEFQRYSPRKREAAIATYGAAVAAHPNAVMAHVPLITMLLEQGDTAGARTGFEKLKAVQPKHPETVLIEAQLAHVDRNYARTRELTDQLLRIYPDDMRLLLLAGVNELRLNSLTQAEAHLGRLMKAQPAAPQPRHLLAGIYTRTGQPGKALEVLKPLIEGPKTDSTSLTLAGTAWLQLGEPARAETAFAAAAKGNPQATQARTVLALGKVARGNASAGFAELEAVAADDKGLRSNLALVAARMRSNDLPGALKAIDDLEKKQPASPIAQSLRGSVLMQKGDTVGATAAFEKALKIDPLFYSATAGLAGIEFAAGKPEAAQKRFETVLQRDPRNTRALLGLAELKARTGGSKDDVTAAVTAAAKANPGEAGPHVLLVKHLLSHGDTAAALAAAQNGSALLPNSFEVMDALGTAQLAVGQAKQAVITFTKLASLRPDNPEPQLRLAEAHIANKDPGAAKDSLKKVLEIRPGLFAAQRALALIALREDNPQEALRIAQAVQKAQPQQTAGFLLEAEIEFGRNQPDAATVPLRKALALGGGTEIAIRLHSALEAANRGAEAGRLASTWSKDKPRDAGFRFYQGDKALAGKDYSAAETHYRSVLEIQPNNPLALNNVAWLMAQQKRPGALALAEKANTLLPDQPALMDTLAYLLALENQAPRAVELQKKAMAKSPQDQGLRLTLAKIYLQTGDKAQARIELQTLAKLGDKFGAQAEVTKLMAAL